MLGERPHVSPLHEHYREAQVRESAQAATSAAREKERMLTSPAGEAGNLLGGAPASASPGG